MLLPAFSIKAPSIWLQPLPAASSPAQRKGRAGRSEPLHCKSAARARRGTQGWQAGDSKGVCLSFLNLERRFSPRLISINNAPVIARYRFVPSSAVSVSRLQAARGARQLLPHHSPVSSTASARRRLREGSHGDHYESPAFTPIKHLSLVVFQALHTQPPASLR